MTVHVIKTLTDCVERCIDEGHPAFRIAWNEAGFIARTQYIRARLSSPLRAEVEKEITEVRSAAAISTNKNAWHALVEAADEYVRTT